MRDRQTDRHTDTQTDGKQYRYLFRKVGAIAGVLVINDKQCVQTSYDGCLEVRGEIIRTVLCCIVY